MRKIIYGKVKLNIAAIMDAEGISINHLAVLANLERIQVKAYRDNTVQRLDRDIIARLCWALDCDISDLITYIPPEELEKPEDE